MGGMHARPSLPSRFTFHYSLSLPHLHGEVDGLLGLELAFFVLLLVFEGVLVGVVMMQVGWAVRAPSVGAAVRVWGEGNLRRARVCGVALESHQRVRTPSV